MSRGVSVRVIARLVVGAVTVAAAATAVGAGILLPTPAHTGAPVRVTVTPPAAAAVLTCPGPLLSVGGDTAGLGQLASGDVLQAGAQTTTTMLRAAGVAGPARLTATGHGDALAAASSATATGADVAGFAAAACQPALLQSWLVGGSSTTGAADLVLLANPGAVPATVDLTLYGAQGPERPAAGQGVVVAAGSQVAVPLASLGLNEQAPVIRVTATGAPVRAMLQTSITRVLASGGVDWVAPVPAAARTQVMTGVRVTAAPGDDPTTVLRLVSAGHATSATIRVHGPSGVVGTTQTVPLGAGSPVEVALDGLAAGTAYSVVVDAAEPVAAAVWQASGTGAGSDFAWVPASPALRSGTDTLVQVPSGPAPQLSVYAASAAEVTLTPENGGPAQQVHVPAAGTAAVAVAPGQAYRVTATGDVSAAISFAGPGALATVPVWPSDTASGAVTVYP